MQPSPLQSVAFKDPATPPPDLSVWIGSKPTARSSLSQAFPARERTDEKILRENDVRGFPGVSRSRPMATDESRAAAPKPNLQSGQSVLLARFDSFDLLAERVAISVLKLASWIMTVAVVLYGLWRSF
jgi:hypothetical protein